MPAPKTVFPPSTKIFCAPRVTPTPDEVPTTPNPPPSMNRVPDSARPPPLMRPQPNPGDTKGTNWTPPCLPNVSKRGALEDAVHSVTPVGFANPILPLSPSVKVARPDSAWMILPSTPADARKCPLQSNRSHDGFWSPAERSTAARPSAKGSAAPTVNASRLPPAPDTCPHWLSMLTPRDGSGSIHCLTTGAIAPAGVEMSVR